MPGTLRARETRGEVELWGVNARGRAHDPERGKPLSVSDQERDRWEAGFHGEYPSGRGGEAICGPSLDLVPKGVQAGCRAHTGCEQVRAVE